MYLRQTSRTNQDGSKVTYLQLAHNEWDAEAGHARARILYNFGRADQVDRAALERLVRSICRFLSPEAVAQAEALLAGRTDVRIARARDFGGAWLLDQLWQRLGIRGVLEGLIRDRAFRRPMERLVFALVANRALAPRSKLAVEDWVAREAAIPELAEVAVQQLYRAMDFVLEAGEALQREVYFAVANLLNLEVDLLYFDTSSTYFELELPDDEDEPLRRYGYSRDRRPDRPQAVIGLAVTRDGIPVRCWVGPGDTADLSVIEEVKRDLCGWKLGRVITVVDRGFASEANLRILQRAGGHYIAGERLATGKPAVEAALARRGRYHKVRDNLEVKEIVVGEGEARQRFILVRNPEQAERDRTQRQQLLARLRQELDGLRYLPEGQHTRAVCALRDHPAYGRYLRQCKDGRLQIDPAKVKAAERLDGKYLLRTSDDTLSPEDVALGYKQLIEIEDAFRTLKQTLELRPVYHRLADRIRAHVLLCWLALLLVRVAERETGQSWRRLRDAMQRIKLAEIVTPDGRITQRTELAPEHKAILNALKLKEPPRILDVQTTRSRKA